VTRRVAEADQGVSEGEISMPCPACGSTRILMTVDEDGNAFWQWDCGTTGQTGRYERDDDGRGWFYPDVA